MKKLRALAFSFLISSSQLLSAAAQTAAPAPAAAPSPPPAPVMRAPEPSAGNDFPDVDTCKPILMEGFSPHLSITSPAEWRGRRVELYTTINQDGSVADTKPVSSNGAPEAMKMAAVALVKQAYRWAPLTCGRNISTQRVTVAVPRQNCTASSWRAPLPLTLAQEDRGVSASLEMKVAVDGRMEPRLTSGSGNAALDAALLAHVRQNWVFWPMRAGCAPDTRFAVVRFPQAICIPKPVVESRSMPEVGAQDRQRST